MRLRTWFLGAPFLAAATALAQSPGLGPILMANSYTTGGQMKPSVATGPDGRFVVTWESFGQEGNSSRGIFGQRFDALGTPVGGEFQANSYTPFDQRDPQVAFDSAGNFVIVWEGARSGDSQGIALRIYDSTGAPVFGTEREAHTATDDPEDLPRVARNDSGFVIVWRHVAPVLGWELRGQQFDTDSDPIGATFEVAAFTTAEVRDTSIAMDASGRFVVAWTSYQDGDATGIRARSFNSAALPLTGEFNVNSATAGFQTHPSVAMDDSGGFVVAWDNSYASDFPIQARRYDSDANPVGGTTLLGHGIGPFIARRSDGGYGAVWVPATGNTLHGAEVKGGRFDDALLPVGAPFDVHDATTQGAFSRKIAANDGRHLVFAWEDSGEVYFRRGGFPDKVPFKVDERAASAGSSNQNGVLETGERVTVDPAYVNFSGSPYTLAGTASDFKGPAGPLYTIHDASADYGTLAAAPIGPAAAGSSPADCFSASGNCLEFELAGARPPGTPHWDATYAEALSEGVSVTRTLHVGGSFADVPGTNIFTRYIENLFHNGITAGGACGGYCPTDGVKRQQMAVFLLKSRFGPSYTPPGATGTVFADVPISNPFVQWIEDLYARGITGGCSGGPPPAPINYCPDAIVNRQQMAVFLLKTLEGSAYTPPAAAGIFQDVPGSSPFIAWIEELYARQVTGGCVANPLQYCPANPTNRQQMAAFLVKAFGLVLYGP